MAGKKKVKEALDLIKNKESSLSFNQVIDLYEYLYDADLKGSDYSLFLKVKKSVDEYDKNQGISHLTYGDAKDIERNYTELEHLTAGIDPFAKDKDGNYVYPENAEFDKFFEEIDIQTVKEGDPISKKEFKKDIAKQAINMAIADLVSDPDFNKKDYDKNQKLVNTHINDALDRLRNSLVIANINEPLISIEAQKKVLESIVKKSKSEKDIKKAQNDLDIFNRRSETVRAFVKLGLDEYAKDVDNFPRKFRNTTVAAAMVTSSLDTKHRMIRIGARSGVKGLEDKAKALNKKMSTKYKKAYKVGRQIIGNVALNLGISVAFGPVGLAGLAAFRAGEQVYKSYKKFSEIKKKSPMYKNNFAQYLWENPKEMMLVLSTTASAALSTVFVGAEIAQAGGEVFGSMGIWGSQIKGDVMPLSEDSTGLIKTMGENFVKNIKEYSSDDLFKVSAKTKARTWLSVATGIGNSVISYVKTKGTKKRRAANAASVLVANSAASAAGLFFSSLFASNHSSPEPTIDDTTVNNGPVFDESVHANASASDYMDNSYLNPEKLPHMTMRELDDGGCYCIDKNGILRGVDFYKPQIDKEMQDNIISTIAGDKETNPYLYNKTRTDFNMLAMESIPYHDLIEKQMEGFILNEGEKAFIDNHIKAWEKYGMTYSEGGELVQMPKEEKAPAHSSKMKDLAITMFNKAVSKT
jgi:hypothetical protein